MNIFVMPSLGNCLPGWPKCMQSSIAVHFSKINWKKLTKNEGTTMDIISPAINANIPQFMFFINIHTISGKKLKRNQKHVPGYKKIIKWILCLDKNNNCFFVLSFQRRKKKVPVQELLSFTTATDLWLSCFHCRVFPHLVLHNISWPVTVVFPLPGVPPPGPSQQQLTCDCRVSIARCSPTWSLVTVTDLWLSCFYCQVFPHLVLGNSDWSVTIMLPLLGVHLVLDNSSCSVICGVHHRHSHGGQLGLQLLHLTKQRLLFWIWVAENMHTLTRSNVHSKHVSTE